MSQIPVLRKDPDAKLDFGFDWTNWLASGETISNVTWSVASGLTEVATSSSGTKAVVWLSGGTAGNSYLVACKIETSAGRIDERSFYVVVEDR